MNFKKTLIASLATLAVIGTLTGCGDTKETAPKTGDSSTAPVRVGVSPVPHAEILTAVKEKLAKEGVNLEIVEFNDYVQPNLALSDKSLDANYFQHKPYLDEFASARGLKLKSVGDIHIEPMGLYSSKLKNLSELKDGAHISIPNDPTNGGRALLLLQSAGLIKLRDGAPVTATPQDIAENPKNLQITELEPPQLPRSLDDVELSAINVNFALEAKLDPKTALLTENADSPYVNILVVREGDENRPEIQKLLKALQSPEVKDFINKKYDGAIKAVF